MIIGDFSIPDVFADDAITFDLVNQTIRITFATVRPESPVVGMKEALVATGRLIMPIAGAQRLSLVLHDYLMKRGLDPSASIRDGETPQ
ncbi:hypothetical protein ACFQRC_05390 [Enterovirga sp. GCM10030262]|uniref:hypothetical protein n=1 Tax=Enterovirga sp. GCM10030262 TaxID=3273391 RepID=UPI0036131A73